MLFAVLIVPISCTLTQRAKIETTTEQSQKRYESLYEAAKAGSLSEVKRLIKEVQPYAYQGMLNEAEKALRKKRDINL